MTDTIHTQPELSDDELLRVYGLAKRDHNYEGSIDDWPKLAERAATVAGLRAAIAADRARAALVQPEPLPTHDLSNVAPLLWVLWNHLGARSPVGQPIREYLGMGQFQPMTDAQMAAANQYRALLWNSPQPEPKGPTRRQLLQLAAEFWPEGCEPAQAVPFARAVLARWGSHPGSPDSSGNLKAGLTGSPATSEVAELVAWLRLTADEQPHTSGQGCIRLTRAADLLERLAPQQGTASDELLIQAARRGLDQHHLPTELGYFLDPESIEYEPLLLMLRAVVQCQPALPQPIPVAERLPGPEECLDEGWAWFFNPRTGWRQATQPVHSTYTHWLPAHALPIPSESV